MMLLIPQKHKGNPTEGRTGDLRECWRHEVPGLHGALADALRERAALVLPGLERADDLDDLVALALADVVDADAAHLDVIVEEEVEEAEETVKAVVAGVSREGGVGHGRVGGLTLDGFGEAQEAEAGEERSAGVVNLEVVG